MKAKLRALKDIEPDITDPDAPEFKGDGETFTGKFYRPLKKQVTVRIDTNVLEWFKNNTDKYQTLINLACKEYMMRHQKEKRAAHVKK